MSTSISASLIYPLLNFLWPMLLTTWSIVMALMSSNLELRKIARIPYKWNSFLLMEMPIRLLESHILSSIEAAKKKVRSTDVYKEVNTKSIQSIILLLVVDDISWPSRKLWTSSLVSCFFWSYGYENGWEFIWDIWR